MAALTECSGPEYWVRARERLSQTQIEKLDYLLTNVKTDASGVSTNRNWPERLLQSCDNSRQVYRDKKWKIGINGEDQLLSSLWDKPIDLLDKVKDISATVASVNPIANLCWGIIEKIIQVPILKREIAALVIKGLGKIIIILSRGLVYEHEIRKIWSTQVKTNTIALGHFVVDLYKETLAFLLTACDHYEGGQMHRTHVTAWGGETMMNFDKNTLSIQQSLQDQASAGLGIGIHGSLGSVLASREDLSQQIDQIICLQREQQKEKEKEKLKKLRSWLSKYPCLDKHSTAKDGRVPNTGDWIFQRGAYESWIGSNEQHILWIQGIPGAGKTKLISKFVDRFDTRVRTDPSRDGARDGKAGNLRVAFFYCRRDEPDSRNCVGIMTSIIQQLIEGIPLPSEVLEVYEEKTSEDAPSQQLTMDDCHKMLNGAIDQHNQVCIILDALDECEKDSIKELLGLLQKLVKGRDSGSQFKVVLSSRDPPAARDLIDKFTGSICISTEDNKDDIDKFVRHRLGSAATEIFSEDLKADIVDVITKNSGANFQLALVRLENILRCSNRYDVEEALRHRPSDDLEKEYGRTIEHIKSTSQIGDYAMRALAWLRARGGTSPGDLLVAAASQNPNSDEERVNPPAQLGPLLKACMFLLTFEGGTVRFCHLSVLEYLEDHGANHGINNDFVALIHLRTLLYYDPLMSPQEQLKMLYEDACVHWPEFTKPLETENEAKITSLLQQLFEDPPSAACCRWLRFVAGNISTSILLGHEDEGIESYIFSPAMWVAGSGRFLTTEQSKLAKPPASFAILEVFITQCLLRAKSTLAASSSIHEWKSLESGLASAAAQEKDSTNAIQCVPQESTHVDQAPKENKRGSISVIRILWWLLSYVFTKTRKLMSFALVLVAKKLNPDLKVVSERGRSRDLALRDENGSQKTQSSGNGAEGELKQASSSTVENKPPLCAGKSPTAAEVELIQLRDLYRRFLPSLRAPGNWENCERLKGFFTEKPALLQGCIGEMARLTIIALCLESDCGPEQVSLLKFLFDNYPDHTSISLHDIYNGKTTQNANNWQRLMVSPRFIYHDDQRLYWPKVVKLLTLNGADVNFSANDDDFQYTYTGYDGMERSGMYDDRPGTPLIASVMWYDQGGAELMPLLIDKGANLNQTTRTGQFETALLCASINGFTGAANTLLAISSLEPNMTATRGEYGTAMIAACALGYGDIVHEMLKRTDINVNATVSVGSYDTALIAACVNGRTEIAKTILQREDVNVNVVATMCEYGTALIATCVHGHTEIAKAILQRKDTDVNIVASACQYKTALIAACAHGHAEIAKAILQRKDVNVNVVATACQYGTALIAACARGHMEIIESILQRDDVDVNVFTAIGKYETALTAACAKNQQDIVKRLLAKGARATVSMREQLGEFKDMIPLLRA